MKILINLITQNILWYSNCLSTVNAIEDMKTLNGISKKEYKQLETEFKTACWAITNLHQKWWPWCKRPQSQTVAICLRQTWYHALLSTHMAPQHAWHGSHSLTRLFIRCFRVSFCCLFVFRMISILKYSHGFTQNYIYGKKVNMPVLILEMWHDSVLEYLFLFFFFSLLFSNIPRFLHKILFSRGLTAPEVSSSYYS